MNAIAGVGMIFAGTIGSPAIGTLQDIKLANVVEQQLPAQYPTLAKTTKGQFFDYTSVDAEKVKTLPQEDLTLVETLQKETKQLALADIAVLPAIMCACYLALIVFYKSRGGYKAEVLTGHAADDEKFTGGVAGPVEA
jgi:hypothetical protein